LTWYTFAVICNFMHIYITVMLPTVIYIRKKISFK
jgi:hypothetical protein